MKKTKEVIADPKNCISCGRQGIPDTPYAKWTCPECRAKREKKGLKPNLGVDNIMPIAEPVKEEKKKPSTLKKVVTAPVVIPCKVAKAVVTAPIKGAKAVAKAVKGKKDD